MNDAANWREMRDAQGRAYYINSVTQQTQWETPASWLQFQPPAAQYHAISPQPQHLYVQQQHSYPQQQQLQPQQQQQSLKGILSGAVRAVGDVVKEKVVHAGQQVQQKVIHAGQVAAANVAGAAVHVAHGAVDVVNNPFETEMEPHDYWPYVDDYGHLKLDQAPADSSYALKLRHQKELINERILWTGNFWRDFWIFTRSNHPLLSVFMVDPLHPFSKWERFFHGVVTVLYSVVMGHVCTTFSIQHSKGVCKDETGLFDVKNRDDANCFNFQFWIQVAFIMIPLLVFDKIVYTFAACPCCMRVHRDLRRCCDCFGRSSFYFIIACGISATSIGIWLVTKLPASDRNSCFRVPGGCQSSMATGFAVGRLLGYVTWFLEALPVFWFKYKLNREVCEGCCCHSCCCCCFGAAAVEDHKDLRVEMLKGAAAHMHSRPSPHLLSPS